ncbi:Uncharacterized protein SCG7086_AA_00750 [Chlamydiales bacterium SCGC AG-110-P3]|nr:Uncharacterized protein SCG7086_AA_00750 [Chlamydiales bacterium SCGC AG-110-P3]
MFSKLAYGFGAVFVLAGLLGFCQYAIFNGLLFGYFAVDTLHNLVHLATGALGLAAGFMGREFPKMFFQFLGVAYALVGVAGFYFGDSPLFGMMAHNMYDMYLHFGVAAVGIYLGFFSAE